jgi:transcriptional regulator with XRE-family HTH domain
MNWLKIRREELDLSQEELAARLQADGIEISRSGVSAWETERNNPPLEEEAFRKALAHALRLSIHELLARAGFETIQGRQSREAEVAASLVERMPPDKRKMALRILEAMNN